MASDRVLKVLTEATVVGVLLIIFVYITSPLVKSLKPGLPNVCDDWNKNHVMEVHLFLTGALFHIVCEITGLNKYYVENYSKDSYSK